MTQMAIKKRTLPFKAVSSVISVVLAVLLPQIFHTIGSVTGLGSGVGSVFLPMHIPVLIAGFVAGPVAGIICGVASPAISYLLSGMPVFSILPNIIAELAGYGLFAGLFSKVEMPSVPKILIVQALGRIVKWLAIIVSIYAFNLSSISQITVLSSLFVGIPGILLQITLISPMLNYLSNN